MGTGIEWTDETWNPVVGCSIVSEGCKNCYAMKVAHQRLDGNPKTPQYEGTTKSVNGNAVWTGKLGFASVKKLHEPLFWTKPRHVFVNSMGDVFHEDLAFDEIDSMFAVMICAPRHRFQVLTKRSDVMFRYMDRLTTSEGARKVAERARAICEDAKVSPFGTDVFSAVRDLLAEGPPPNVWLGVSVENQQAAYERIPDLVHSPAAVRFLSCEPLLGPVTIIPEYMEKIDWVIVGGESASGDRSRPMHPQWVRNLRDVCEKSQTAFFFKQWGNWMPVAGEPAKGGTVRSVTIDGKKMPWGYDKGQPQVMRLHGTKHGNGAHLDGLEYKAFPNA